MCRYGSNCGKLCDHFVVTTAVAFADGTLTLTLPDDVTYGNGEKFCIVIGQTIPDTTTITAPVVVTIGDGTVEYPLTNQCCAQLTACSIRTRTKYPVCVATDATGGTFKVLGKVACAPNNALTAIDGTAPAAEGGGAG